MKFVSSLFLLFVLLIISSCTSNQTSIGSSFTPLTFTEPPITSTPSPSSTRDIVEALPSITATIPEVNDTPTPVSTATIGPLELFFPTVIPAEGAEYRPPLYPAPWALSPFDHFYLSAPIAATYPGDPVWDYRYGGVYFGPDVIHSGIDLPAPRGAEVLAAGSGTVVWAGIGLYSGSSYNLEDPFGLAVAIRHDFGYKNQPLFTVYAHMEEVDVVVGQWVSTGDIVGNVGSTGMTTGPHLHFEVRLGENDFWKTRNPELWVAPPQGYGVLVGTVMNTYGKRLDSFLIILKNIESKKQYTVTTYGPMTVNSDEYYKENVVLGDLPAGIYELNIPFGTLNRKVNIQILPGQITYFSFQGYKFFDFNLPSIAEPIIP